MIGLTNRPLSPKDAMLPDDERWELHSGMNLTKSLDDVVLLLKRIPEIEATTHVYFGCKLNSSILRTLHASLGERPHQAVPSVLNKVLRCLVPDTSSF